MFDRKALFDKIRDIKGAKLTQGDVDAINAILDPAPASPTPIAPAPHSRLKASTILAAQASERACRIPTSVSLAQYALESAWGAKDLGVHNYGGIKVPKRFYGADGKPTVPYKRMSTREVINGKPKMMDQDFMAFASEEAYFLYHAKLISEAAVYAGAMAALPNLREFVRIMADGGDGPGGRPGYATAPDYAKALLSIMTTSKLLQYDLGRYTL